MKSLLLIFAILVFTSPIIAQNGTVQVSLTGIENDKGYIQIGIYNTESNFPIFGKEFKGEKIKSKKEGVKYTFNDLPEGDYAIAVWQDKNNNEKMDKNFFGSPTEKYGFSKNIFGLFGPPNFDKVAFKVTNDNVIKLAINLK